MHVFVSGRVQGVFFRAECARMAREHGVSGFARNLADGRVESVFEGPAGAVDAMVAWCHEGPKWAGVESVEVSNEEPAGDRDFRVR